MPPKRSKYFCDETKKINKRTKLLATEISESNTDEDRLNSVSETETLKIYNGSVDKICDNLIAKNRLKEEFFNIPCVDLAKKLLGKILVRVDDDGTSMKGKIVETECYLGGIDKASHSYNGKITPRNKPMFMKPGTLYVYFTYGMYHCFNISSQGEGAAVLIRALEPVEGIKRIMNYRLEFGHKKESSHKKQDIKLPQLCNGPGKLCVGFNITKTLNEEDLCSGNKIWIECEESSITDIKDCHIVISKRIGIDSVGEPWASEPLRFYIYNSPFVSKRDKKQEEIIKQHLDQFGVI